MLNFFFENEKTGIWQIVRAYSHIRITPGYLTRLFLFENNKNSRKFYSRFGRFPNCLWAYEATK